MLERYSFIPVFTCLLGGVAWWTTQVGPTSSPDMIGESVEKISANKNVLRRDLVEFLDRVVSYQYYYHSVYGKFSKSLSRVGLKVPQSLLHIYDVRVTDATADKLLVSAVEEADDKISDLISINQDFRIQANFKIPPPRASYLSGQALKYMRLLKGAPPGQKLEEAGIFKGYFHFSANEDRKLITARGIRPPVLGIYLELNPNSGPSIASVESELALMNEDEGRKEDFLPGEVVTGQKASELSLEEEARLAQKIFLGEIGRYARDWSELSRIASFRFEGKEQSRDLESRFFKEVQNDSARVPASTSYLKSFSHPLKTKGGLVIEAVKVGEDLK